VLRFEGGRLFLFREQRLARETALFLLLRYTRLRRGDLLRARSLFGLREKLVDVVHDPLRILGPVLRERCEIYLHPFDQCTVGAAFVESLVRVL